MKKIEKNRYEVTFCGAAVETAHCDTKKQALEFAIERAKDIALENENNLVFFDIVDYNDFSHVQSGSVVYLNNRLDINKHNYR